MKKKIILALSFASVLCLGGLTTISSCGEESLVDGPVLYNVKVEADSSVSVTGLNVSGYDAGETVTFTVKVNDENKVIDTVKVGNETLTGSDGSYSFTMPEGNVTVEITLKTISADLVGEGTEESPYKIDNKLQLLSLSEKLANNVINTTSYISLEADVDLTGEEWSPIGTYDLPFRGVFDGNGHTIKGLKIKDFTPEMALQTQTVRFGGMFGVTESAQITDLKFSEYTIDSSIHGKNSVFYFGGLVGLAQNTIVSGIDISFSKASLQSLQNGSSGIYFGGVIGAMYAYSLEAEVGLYLDFDNCRVSGDIVIDTTDSEGVISYVGGILGETYCEYGNGIISISNMSYFGNISGGTYIGGIAGYLDTYTSVLDVFAIGDSLVSEDTSGSYVGGIVGGASYETLIMNAYSGYETITAPESESAYVSYAGTIYGFGLEDGFAEQSDYFGTGVANSYYKKGVKLASQNTVLEGKETELTGIFFKDTLNLNEDLWDFSGEYPVLKDEIKLEKVNVTLKTGVENDQDITVDVQGGTYDYEAVQKIQTEVLEKEMASFNGFTYDEEGEVSYRWYAPFNNDTTLYAKFTDLTPLIGDYTYECKYYENIMSEGFFKFTEDVFYWINDDNQVMKYDYELRDEFIFIGECLPSATGDGYGAYSDSIFMLNEDGTITGYDLTDNDAVYTATKTTDEIVIPDYTGNKMLGKWYTESNEFELYYDGTVVGRRDNQDYDSNGGFKIDGVSIDVSLFGVLSDVFIYDEENDLLISESGQVAARSKINDRFATEDGSLSIVLIGDKSLVIKEGVLTDLVVDGELSEGSQITVDGKKYKVEGNELIEVIEEPEEPTKTGFYGTWKGKVGQNSVELVICSDGTVTYNDTEVVCTIDGNTITGKDSGENFELTIVYDEVTQSLKVTYLDLYEYYEFEGTLTDFTPEASNVPGYVGTWKGKVGIASVELILNEDGTGSYNGTTFTYTVDGNKITAVADNQYFTLEMNYDENTQSLKVNYSDEDYNEFDGTLTDFIGAESGQEAKYLGTWTGKVGIASVTLILNSDGTGSYNGTTFKYTAEGNTLSATADTGYFTLEITYNEVDDTLDVYYSDEDYNELDGTLSR